MSKILIIEDDPLLSQMYQDIFSLDKSYTVIMANSGEEGVEKARLEKPIVVLCDMVMPGMNGLQVLDELKSEQQTKAIPVVMLTNMSNDEDIKAAMEKGAVKYIIKSNNDPEQLLKEVKEVVATVTQSSV